MAKRPEHSLLYIGAQRTDRVDFGPAPAFSTLAEQHQQASASDDIATRVESTLMAPRAGKTVWILWEGASAQVLDMPAGVVEGLEREQLAETLSFEAEPLTGVSSMDSAIDGLLQKNADGVLPDFRRFWVTQLPASVREKIETAVLRANAKLGAIAHPGGLPRAQWDNLENSSSAAVSPSTEWRRVEIWDQVTFSLHGKPGGALETRVIRSAPSTEGWNAEMPGSGAIKLLDTTGRHAGLTLFTPDGLPLRTDPIHLFTDAVPIAWLRAWLEELTAKTRRVPAVEPVSRVSPHRNLFIGGGIAAAVVLAICIGHGAVLAAQGALAGNRADELEARRKGAVPVDTSAKDEQDIIAQTEPLKAKLLDLEKREVALAAETARAEKRAADFTQQQTQLTRLQAVHRPALAELISALADAERTERTGDIVIKEVRQNTTGELRLTGLCRQSVFADNFTSKLEARLTKAGWRVSAAQKHLRDDRLAFDFVVTLTPLVLSEAPNSELLNQPAKSAAPIKLQALLPRAGELTRKSEGGR